MRHRWCARIAAAAGATLLGLLFVETISLTFGLFVPADFGDRQRYYFEFYHPHPDLGYTARPDLDDFHLSWLDSSVEALYSTDAHGFRNPAHEYSTAPVFVIGDSFTWGAWVPREETFVGLLERELGVPVVSLAVGGYDFRHYEVLFEKYVARYRPELALLVVFANDLLPTPESIGDPWVEYGWNGYRSLSLWQRSFSRRLMATILGWVQETPSAEVRSRIAREGLTLYRYRGASRTYFEKGENEAVERRLARIIEIAASADVELALALAPSKESVHAGEYRQLFPEAGDYLEVERHGYERLCEIASTHGVGCLDLTSALRRWSDRDLYFDRDPHWTAVGHRLVADEIGSFLADQRQ